MRVAEASSLTPEERQQLVEWSRGRALPQRLVERARIVLAAAEGKQNKQIAEKLGLDPHTVALWRNRFSPLRIPGTQKDAPRPGRNPQVTLEAAKAVVVKTLRTKPRGRTHWSTRVMAREAGLDHVTVHRIWKRYGLRPHQTRSFKLSQDPRFVEKLIDEMGVYQNPPDQSVIFRVDAKPETQAPERAPALLPMGKDWPEGRPHDDRRHGPQTSSTPSTPWMARFPRSSRFMGYWTTGASTRPPARRHGSADTPDSTFTSRPRVPRG